ncbi:MAG TPA: hypothetical protein VGI10_00830 [Polyangiaceae bacterium]|jgi:hypothetical protein
MKLTSPGAFTRIEDDAHVPVELSLAPNESVIGWYRNPAPWQHCLIVFTSEAFYVVDGERTDRIFIGDIVGYEDPKSKTDVTGVRVLTKDGFRFVRVAGSFGPAGNQKDAYSFIMVVRAVSPSEPLVSFWHDPTDNK